MNPYAMVAEFHAAFGQLVADKPELPSRELRELRINLLTEEYLEYHDADAQDDIVEVADALADILYILSGTAVTYGTTPFGHAMPQGVDVPPALPGEIKRNDLAKSLRVTFEAYRAAEASNEIENIDVALTALREAVYAAASAFLIPLDRVFAEVHRSNMSKLGPDGKPLLRNDGKIMKPPTFSKPDIAKVLFGN